MKEDINVETALAALDAELTARGQKERLYTCGGAVLILLGYEGRGTSDVDVITQKMSPKLREAAEAVAIKLRYSPDWLNNNVASLEDRLERGWKKRCSPIFSGRSLEVLSISRQDLINSKLHAAVDRQKYDLDDLIWLQPTDSELEIAAEYAIKQDDSENRPVFVNAFVRVVRDARK